MLARKTHTVEDIAKLLGDPGTIARMRSEIQQGDVYVVKDVVPREKVGAIRRYLENVGRSSLPNYQKIEPGAPNFHRVNYGDERAYVHGCFHQFSFFPWNQDVFNLFGLFRDGYYLKNQVCGLAREKFLNREPDDGCIARLSFQFYPAGVGRLNLHSDPVDHHQLAVPTLTMSQKGRDFRVGGAYLLDSQERKIYSDEISEVGDVVFFNAVIPHGVDPIDPDKPVDWPAFEGRWVMLFATNKLHGSGVVADAQDLEKRK